MKKKNQAGVFIAAAVLVPTAIFAVWCIADKVREFIANVKDLFNRSTSEILDLLKVFGVMAIAAAIVFGVLKLLQKAGVIPAAESNALMIKASVYTGGMICALIFMGYLIFNAVNPR